MNTTLPLTKDLVLIGAGHTHALVLRKWGMAPLPGTRLTVINPAPYAAYSGMLPGHVAGHYSRADLDIDVVRLARFAGARLILGAAAGIDRQAKTIHVPGRPPVRYDLASIDVGITAEMPNLPGFADFGVPAKPLGHFAQQWEAYVARATTTSQPPQIVVIGAGVAGAELAMAMAWRLRSDTREAAQVSLIDAGAALSGTSARARQRLLRDMASLGVRLHEHVGVARLTATHVELSDGTALPFTFCTGAAGARPHDWISATGLKLQEGYIPVGPDLRSPEDAALYATGDCAHMIDSPRPKAGVFAVRQAPVLLHNLRADLSGGARKRYTPQRSYLKLISLGRQHALAEKGPFIVAGARLWNLKDRIDQAFMEKFRTLPAMKIPALPRPVTKGVQAEIAGNGPLCGGCGAKVGPEALRAGLASLGAPNRADVLSLPGDDAAILQIGTERQVITTDHLRAFCDDPWLMARVAMVHALGDVWAMGAQPQAVLSSLVLPPMSQALQAATLDEITRGAASIAGPAGAALVGGHTSLGAELSIGFTVTGLADGPLRSLDGARAGDALILTKPLGSGVLLAAEMQKAAKGHWITALYAALQQPQGDAAQVLAPKATAMTDVTGFGLAGHLMGILNASGCGATLRADTLPAFDGARDVLAAGIRSSLHGANLHVILPDLAATAPNDLIDLICDPQTSGGLLAAVPSESASGLLADLIAQGYPAVQIGALTTGPARITLD